MYGISLKAISKSFGTNKILEKINLQIQGGKILAIIGSNGSGKSTLLKIMLGIEEPSDGEIIYFLDNTEIKAREFLSRIGAVTPELAFYSQLTVAENMELFLKLRNISVDKYMLVHYLQRMDLAADVLNKFMAELSTGMAQRVKLAVLLASQADIWLLDEAASNIDDSGVNLLLKEIKEAKKKGILVIMATNDSREVAIADEIFRLC